MRAATLVVLLLAVLVLTTAAMPRVVPPSAVILCWGEVMPDKSVDIVCTSSARYAMRQAKFKLPDGQVRDVIALVIDVEDAERIAKEQHALMTHASADH